MSLLHRQTSVATTSEYTLSTSASGSAAADSQGKLKHPYLLHVHLISGTSLVVRDSNGFSDPFVKLKLGRKLLARSRVVPKTLDPIWNERFQLKVKDVDNDLELRVYDRDRLQDDYMGHCFVPLGQLCLGQLHEFCVDLTDETGKAEEPYMGSLTFSAKLLHRLIPEELTEEQQQQQQQVPVDAVVKSVAQASLSEVGGSSFVARLAGGKRQHNAVVILNLIDGRSLLAMDDSGTSDPYVKFRLGEQKYKSRVVKQTLSPFWGEEFEMRLFPDEDQILQVSVFDHDVAGQNDFMGRTQVVLKRLAWEKTHVVEAELLDGAGILRLLVTITGATISSVSSVSFFSERGRQQILNRYSLARTAEDFRDVGWLQVKVIRAERLLEEGHKVDAFCVLEVGNSRLQTHTEYRTSSPSWDRIFVFDISDLHDRLELWVYDENKDKKSHSKCLGRLALRLLRLRNGGRRWYALRDKNLESRVTGHVQMETDLVFNSIRAAVRTLNPPEQKLTRPEPKFKLSLVRRNVNRFMVIVDGLIDFGSFVDSCWQWESPARSSIAFACYMTLVWNFQIHLLPFTLSVLLLTSLCYRLTESYFQRRGHDSGAGSGSADTEDHGCGQAADAGVSAESSDGEQSGGEGEELSWRDRIKAAHGILVKVQQGLDLVASMCESLRHTFDWTEPWLSALALLLLTAATVLLYLFPIRLLALAWGVNKFTKKILRPHAIDNNEVLDFLSRVPSDVDLAETKEIRVSPNSLSPKKTA